ncbi:PAS domain S-box protein [Massilia sp. CF038]|uniref:PAS domain S-box protein n=1 Tax=Massilia sp. CF038 TaxID=1881045 RepID=UPI0009185CF6|nr:PAS domain S-box protein [Massilia sp. CF038]SHG59873.1 PAS domain S-box-containing protein/diguanylate cyclase (GGDEF) domain-containing protein [Massilia sp. CF038]
MKIAGSLGKLGRRLSRVVLLPAFALALLISMWSAVLIETSAERQASHAEAVARSESLARVLSAHVSHVLRQADHATQLYRLRHEGAAPAAGTRPWSLAEFERRGGLLDSVLPARLGLPMARFDRNGGQIDAVNGFGPADVSRQSFFQTLAANNNDLAVFSTVVTDARSGRWQIQVARRLHDRQQRFDGAIVIRIEPDLFVDDYDRLNLDDNGALLLMNPLDGLSVGRAGERLFVSDRVKFEPQRSKGGSSSEMLPVVPLDGVARIYSASEMPRYGLTTIVGIEAQGAMARYQRHRTQYLAMAAIATILISTVIAILMRQSTRLRRSVHLARRAQATLRAAADGSLDGFMILKASRDADGAPQDFIIEDLNHKAAAMFGRTREALLGQAAFSLMPRFRTAGFFERYCAALAAGEPLEEEIEVRLDGDAPRWIHHQIVPLQDGVAVTSRDISARKRAEIEIHNNRSFLQSLIEHLPLLIYARAVRGADAGVAIVWNKAAEDVTGYSAAHVMDKPYSQAFPPDYALCNPLDEREMLLNPRVIDQPEMLIERPDGSRRYLHAVAVPLYDGNGKTEFMLWIAEDISLRREQEQSLRASEAHLTAVTNASPLGLVRADMWGNCTYVNKRFETITGLTREQALGRGWLAPFQNDEVDYMPIVFEHQRRHDEPFVKITRCRHTDGKLIWASTKIAAIRINGRIEGFIGTIDDITTLREAELALRESEARLRTIADTLPTMVAYIDADQVYRFLNRAYDREFGRGGDSVVGQSILATIGPARYATLAHYIKRALAGETLMYEEQDEHDGVERTMEVTYIPQISDDGASVTGFHVMRQDITSQKREKKRLLKLAQVDPLTGLANRAGFMQKLTLAMQENADEARLMALMYMDIDHFKPVNDTHGHQVGDALLKAFSARLTHTLRASDTIARLGGDEFTIVMEKLGRREDATILAEKIVSAMQAPFQLNDVTVQISASIGLAYFSDGPIDPDALIRDADRLLYQAKQAGRNTYRTTA